VNLRVVPDLPVTLAERVADGAVALLDHDSSCRDFACLQRDGCPERAALMAAHNAL
jgi:hypothetical protein